MEGVFHENQDGIVEAIKYLRDNKAVGLDSIVAELLKSGGPCLVNALNEMIQQIWIGKTLPESWTDGVLQYTGTHVYSVQLLI
jgi:hypothetical protein